MACNPGARGVCSAAWLLALGGVCLLLAARYAPVDVEWSKAGVFLYTNELLHQDCAVEIYMPAGSRCVENDMIHVGHNSRQTSLCHQTRRVWSHGRSYRPIARVEAKLGTPHPHRHHVTSTHQMWAIDQCQALLESLFVRVTWVWGALALLSVSSILCCVACCCMCMAPSKTTVVQHPVAVSSKE
uniref:Uncharacterized protein n=1 Tax=Zooxanthella nutricula TaxID=1333877 RepID=A0A7S2IRS8_9DINO